MDYRCEICQREFKSASGLAGHMAFKHGQTAATDSEVGLEELIEAAGSAMGELRSQMGTLQKQLDTVSERLNQYPYILPGSAASGQGSEVTKAIDTLQEELKESRKAAQETKSELESVKEALAKAEAEREQLKHDSELLHELRDFAKHAKVCKDKDCQVQVMARDLVDQVFGCDASTIEIDDSKLSAESRAELKQAVRDGRVVPVWDRKIHRFAPRLVG